MKHQRETVGLDLFGLYLDQIGRHPLLTQDDQIRLAHAYQAGLHARRTLATVDPDDPARPQLQAAVTEGERSYGSRRDAEAPHRRLTTEEPF